LEKLAFFPFFFGKKNARNIPDNFFSCLLHDRNLANIEVTSLYSTAMISKKFHSASIRQNSFRTIFEKFLFFRKERIFSDTIERFFSVFYHNRKNENEKEKMTFRKLPNFTHMSRFLA
jgi:hypothetical protein